ncbi:pilus assembly protein PilS, partial [Neisseria meningitidis]
SSFPHRWESRSVRTGTYAPSFPRKRESRPFGFSFLISGNF